MSMILRFHRKPLRYLAAVLLVLCAAQLESAAQDEYVTVKAQVKPDRPWKEYRTRTVAGLPGFKPGSGEIGLNRYGGRTDLRDNGTGFFRVERKGDRWWLFDPEGCAFIHIGLCSTRPGRSKAVREAFQNKYGTSKNWAETTTAMLRKWGLNGTGCWSDTETLRDVERPLVYTQKWSFMGDFGGRLRVTHQQSGHLGYPKDCMPVFHPDFEKFCDEYARALASTKDDPWLLGHFSDNELPAPRDLLDRHLSLGPNAPILAHGYRVAHDWLAKRKGPQATKSDITDEDREAFRGYVYERYFELTSKAMRKYDPNHLLLGPRLHGSAKSSPAIFRAAGKYLDVIAVNYYGVWGPVPETMAYWQKWSGRPVMITEFYTKGADADPRLTNVSGAGWIVPTQNDRGLFYQHYILGLLESKTCVGWHYFKYMDNDPDDLSTDPSNRDSNKGIVTIKFEEYTPFLERMKTVNDNVYPLIDYFDSRSSK